MKLDSLNELFLEELADIYDAENQLIKALPKMAKAAQHPELKQAFQNHLDATKGQVDRLDSIVDRLGRSLPRKTCKGMKGLIDEGDEMAKKSGDPSVIDAGLIGAAQRVEHYEIAAYGCARTYAEMIGDQQAVTLLQQSLDEEKEADDTLNRIALRTVNVDAAHATAP